MSWWFQRTALVCASCCFLATSAFTTKHPAFVTAPLQRPYLRSSFSKLESSTAGQGGGIFYDGASEFGTKPDQDIQTKSATNLAATTTSPQLVAKPNQQTKDIVIIGGGLAGLAAALYVSQMAPHRQVTIVEKQLEVTKNTTVASFAAAGMLAPQSERLPKGPLLDLCLASRRLYPEFIDLVETLAQDPECAEYLHSQDGDRPWSVGYVASGGFLAPAFAGDSVATWAPPDEAGTATWLDATQVRELEPNLDPKVMGGWWFPEDASVDARRLTCSLRAACAAAGVQLKQGEVTSLDLNDGSCRGVWLKSGKYIHTASVLVANGAWMRTLLPVPIEPHKGQSLSLRMPPDQPPLLKRVLFAQDSYICPKADGRIVIGATVEAGSYDPNVTPAGIIHCLSHALQLVPALADLPIEETWVGLRPTTPDKGPILGKTKWDNLFLAGGYWRNGVLLAPKTGQLLASLLADLEISTKDQALLDAFEWDRFISAEGGAKMAADARYAASMHPIHKRTSGVGVAASVGTELGVYSDARTAKEERERDRNALWQSGGDDDALERAAQMGVQDAAAFQHGEKNDDEMDKLWKESGVFIKEEEEEEKETTAPTSNYVASLNPAGTSPFEGSPDAITVHSYPMESTKSGDSDSPMQSPEQDIEEQAPPSDDANLDNVYEKIRKNKRQNVDMSEKVAEEKPDPGFRIYHVDSETRETRMVPPYTSPHDFLAMIAKEKAAKESPAKESSSVATDTSETVSEGDSILDGYQAIQDAHADETADETAEAFRKARMSARSGFGGLDLDIDEASLPDIEIPPEQTPQPQQETTTDPSDDDDKYPDLSNIYKRIKTNKDKQEVEMGEAQPDERPDPGFRIHRVDSETGQHDMVPPYTSPEEMEELIAAKKQQETPPVEATNVLNAEPASNGKYEPDAEYNEQTYDGYTDIQQANSRDSRQEELEAMRAVRRRNRASASEIDISDIGAQRSDDLPYGE